MTWQPLQLPTQWYAHETIDVSAQRLVNLFPEIQPPEGKAPVALLGAPGLTLRQVIGTGPIRGMIKFGADVMVVTGNRLYRWESGGATTDLGFVPGVGLVQMAKSGTQVAILVGPAAADLFIATASTLTQVTDPDYPGASSVAFIDGYFAFTRAGTGQWFISDLNDGLSYDALQIATAEGAPDLLVAIFVDHREVLLLGEDTAEIWYNSGESPFPFKRAGDTFIEKGLASKFAVAALDNQVYFLGGDGIVYRLSGYLPEPISTPAIAQMIERSKGWGDIQFFAYTQAGHPFLVVKKPNKWTLLFDASTQRWHQRMSSGREDWLIASYLYAFDAHLVGNHANGNVYALDIDAHGQEGSDTVPALAAFPVLWNNAEDFTIKALIIDFAHGVGVPGGGISVPLLDEADNPLLDETGEPLYSDVPYVAGADPLVQLRVSRDGGHNWKMETPKFLGRIGEHFVRCKWDQLGRFNVCALEVTIADPVKRCVLGAYADIERGKV